jgi:hypothetical protein
MMLITSPLPVLLLLKPVPMIVRRRRRQSDLRLLPPPPPGMNMLPLLISHHGDGEMDALRGGGSSQSCNLSLCMPPYPRVYDDEMRASVIHRRAPFRKFNLQQPNNLIV